MLGEVLDSLSDWIYSIASGLANGDVDPPEELLKEEFKNTNYKN